MARIIVGNCEVSMGEMNKRKIYIDEINSNSENNNIIFRKYPRIEKTRGEIRIVINGSGNEIEICEDVIIGGRLIIKIVPALNAITDDCRVKIGKDCFFNGTVQMNVNEGNNMIIVGNDCLFANNVNMLTSDSHTIYSLDTNEKLNEGKNINIGNHVWIAQNVYMLRGTYISDNSVVGMGTITKNQFGEENVVIAGVPGRIVRRNINWDKSNKWPL